MSFLSDLGGIAREFLEVKDEITKSVTDSATSAVSSVSVVRDDAVESLQSAATDIAAVRDDIAQTITPVKNQIIDNAKKTFDELTINDQINPNEE